VARRIEWDGEWVASLIDGADGQYLVPPIVFDTDGEVIMGREVLAAIAVSGVSVEHPILRDFAPGDLAALEQKLARIADSLGVPLGSL
jgi:hypothetical protein